MFCQKCGKELNDNAKFCENCGTPTNLPVSNQNQNNAQNMGSYTETSNAPKKKGNTVLKTIVVIIIIIFSISLISGIASVFRELDSTNTSNSVSNTETTEVEVSQEEVKKQENSFVDIANVTQEQEQAILAILNQCGIETVSKITFAEEQSNETASVYTLTSPQSKKGTVILYLNQGVVGGLTFNDEPLYKDGAVVTTIDNILNRPDLEVLSHTYTSEGYVSYVTGEIRNNTNRKYSYVQVEIGLYSDDALVGSTLDNVNNLEPGQVWKFKAIIFEDSANKYKITDITGF